MDGLEADLTGRATVLRIDFLSSVGRQLAGQHDISVIPGLLLFDGEGNLMIRQQGLIKAGEIRDAVLRLDQEAP